MKRILLSSPTASIREYIEENYLIDGTVDEINDNPRYADYYGDHFTNVVKSTLIHKLKQAGFSEAEVASIDEYIDEQLYLFGW